MNSSTESSNKKTHPIAVAAKVVGDLAFACRQKGYSLRLLAALMDTESYGVAYQSMISAEKGRGGVRGPTHHSEKALLESNANHLLAPMAARGITPRRWCSAYFVDLCALFAPEVYELNTEMPILELLKEDFPDAYGLVPAPYTHAYQSMEGFQHITNRKKKIHIYKIASAGISVVSHQNGKALGLACKIQGLMIQAERLRVLLTDGPAAALAWIPTKPVIAMDKLNDRKSMFS